VRATPAHKDTGQIRLAHSNGLTELGRLQRPLPMKSQALEAGNSSSGGRYMTHKRWQTSTHCSAPAIVREAQIALQLPVHT
jgi:hypothetical protein